MDFVQEDGDEEDENDHHLQPPPIAAPTPGAGLGRLGRLNVYTDGVSLHSGTKRHIGAFSVWISEDHPENNAWWTREGTITNQTMELAGARAGLEAIRRIRSNSFGGSGDRVPRSTTTSRCSRSTSRGRMMEMPDEAAEASTSSAPPNPSIVQQLSQRPSPQCTPTTSNDGRGRLAADTEDGAPASAYAVLHVTSHYVINCMTKWLPRWIQTGWITKQKRPVHNGDLLRQMADMTQSCDVRFVRVPPEAIQPHPSGFGSGTLHAPPPHDPHDPHAPSTHPPPSVVMGMRRARETLMEAASEGSHTGCTKQRGNIVCTWQGGG